MVREKFRNLNSHKNGAMYKTLLQTIYPHLHVSLCVVLLYCLHVTDLLCFVVLCKTEGVLLCNNHYLFSNLCLITSWKHRKVWF
jgi:hypothetical protein